MKNYAKGTPIGNNQAPLVGSPPPETSAATTVRDNAAASSILILSSVTTAIEVMATNGPAYLKWLTQSVVDSSVAGTSVISNGASSNFDAMVPINTVRRFVVPIGYAPAPPGSYGLAQGSNRDNNLYRHVAIKTGPIASVATIET